MGPLYGSMLIYCNMFRYRRRRRDAMAQHVTILLEEIFPTLQTKSDETTN